MSLGVSEASLSDIAAVTNGNGGFGGENGACHCFERRAFAGGNYEGHSCRSRRVFQCFGNGIR